MGKAYKGDPLANVLTLAPIFELIDFLFRVPRSLSCPASVR